jgi:hypothetical protein
MVPNTGIPHYTQLMHSWKLPCKVKLRKVINFNMVVIGMRARIEKCDSKIKKVINITYFTVNVHNLVR